MRGIEDRILPMSSRTDGSARWLIDGMSCLGGSMITSGMSNPRDRDYGGAVLIRQSRTSLPPGDELLITPDCPWDYCFLRDRGSHPAPEVRTKPFISWPNCCM